MCDWISGEPVVQEGFVDQQPSPAEAPRRLAVAARARVARRRRRCGRVFTALHRARQLLRGAADAQDRPRPKDDRHRAGARYVAGQGTGCVVRGILLFPGGYWLGSRVVSLRLL